MGICKSAPLFNPLAYPSYLTVTPSTYEDRLLCTESWFRIMHSDSDQPFNKVLELFNKNMEYQHCRPVDSNFLICVISAIVNGKLGWRTAQLRAFDLNAAEWSAAGTSLFVTLRESHEPAPFSDSIATAWNRGFGDVMRGVLLM